MTNKPKPRKVYPGRRPAVTFGSRTDIGCIRQHNEDSLVVSPPLFAVADGMGGHAAGEVASEIAVSTLAEFVPPHADAEALGNAVIRANQEVITAAQDGRGREGMGTTMTAAMLEGERLIIAQVGDSRAYLLHQGSLQQVTRDHSLVADLIEAGEITEQEARIHPQRSVITRALGSDPHMVADIYEINVEAGDRLLLCSDGLSGMITDQEIETTMQHIGDPQRCANMLVNEAIAAGGHDNITVIAVDITGFSEVRAKKVSRRTKISVFFTLLLFVLIIFGAVAGFNYYTENAVYLASEEGKVAIYKGVPGTLFGIEASQLEKITDIEVDELQPGVAARLQEGIRVDDMEAAEELIEEYRKELNKSSTPGSTAEAKSDSNNSDEAPDQSDPRSSTDSSTEADNTDSTES